MMKVRILIALSAMVVMSSKQCASFAIISSKTQKKYHAQQPQTPKTTNQCKTKQASSKSSTTNTNTALYSTCTNLFLTKLSNRFQGDFDNHIQILENDALQKAPREGDGHEHIHCTLVPITPSSSLLTELDVGEKEVVMRIAAFYFDGIPSKIFRLRFYLLYTVTEKKSNEVEMELYTLDHAIEKSIREKSTSPQVWNDILQTFVSQQQQQQPTEHKMFQKLQGCDVAWSTSHSTTRHSYLYHTSNYNSTTPSLPSSSVKDNTAYHAVMKAVNGTILESQMMPGSYVHIQDEISFWENDFWLNDRGYVVGKYGEEFVYGNREGVPYKMTRVALFEMEEEEEEEECWKRRVVREDLAWTLGDAFFSSNAE